MSYQNILIVAEEKLKGEFNSVIIDIKECISSGSTGGEITSMVGKYLKDLETNNKPAYSVMENEIHKYLRYCKKIGLEII
jgi:hypothetical protein